MDSEFQQQQYQHHFQGPQKQFHHQKQQLNSLTRFCSAPSSYFANFLDAADTITNSGGATGGDGGVVSNVKGDFSNSRPLSPETEDIFSRFMASMGDAHHSSQNLRRTSPMQPDSGVRVKRENDTLHLQQQKSPRIQGSYNTTPQMICPSASKPPLASQHSSGSAMGSARVNSSTPHMKIGIGGSSGFGLTRQCSSPAGFFSDLNIQGYDVMGRIDSHADSITSKNQINHSFRQPSSTSEIIRQHTDVQGTIRRMNSLDGTIFSNSHNIANSLSTGPMTSWDESILSKNVGGDDKRRIFSEQNSSNNQTGESRSHPPPLAHQLSLPNTTAELSAMEKLLNLQDAVPLRIRAKRGFATHPRSIAERVRKNKISERMRKLQNLVPNMDKQTNTADMLDLAVDYIKDLQKQVKNMHGIRAKCTCPG